MARKKAQTFIAIYENEIGTHAYPFSFTPSPDAPLPNRYALAEALGIDWQEEIEELVVVPSNLSKIPNVDKQSNISDPEPEDDENDEDDEDDFFDDDDDDYDDLYDDEDED